MPMYLHTLGGLRLEGSSFRRPKPLLLLAYLALEGAQPRGRLAELFFMETSDGKNSLSRALTYLRQEAAGVIEADNTKVWTPISCDAAELLNLTDSKQFEKCLGLYKGVFAAAVDYDLELSGELEEWVLRTRDILKGKARNAFLVLGESEAAKGNFSQAALLAEKAYRLGGASDLEPGDFGRFYNLLYAGNSPLAAEVKKEAEEFEISLELSREEAKAHLSEASEVRIEIPNNLPPPKTSFVGRDQELIEIAMQLAKKDCRLLTLHGMGGIGKSRLAIQAANEQLQVTNPSFKDGVYLVTLDSLTSADLIPSSIAEALSLELQGQEDTLTQVKRFIGKKHVLLLLDNYEHLMSGAILTSKLLEACPNLKLLVTSRERLNVEEEWVLTLDGLTVPTSIQLSEVERFDALHLFVQRAKRARLEFSLTQETLPHALKICQLVEGSPLGIELAAVWVKTLPVSEIAKEIESNLSVLEAPTKNIPQRHQSIRAAFEHSWKLLTEKEQEVLRKLSVFVGDFDHKAAAETCNVTLPLLSGFVDKSLLQRREPSRYFFHPLLVQFILDKLVNKEVFFETKTKHANFYANLLQQLTRRVTVSDQITALEKIEIELRNIEAAYEWLIAIGDFNEVTAKNDLSLFFTRRGLYEEGVRFFSQIISQFRKKSSSDTLVEAILLMYLAPLHNSKGEYKRAYDLSQQSIDIFMRINNPEEYLSIAQTTVAISLEGMGMFVEARKYYMDALRNSEHSNDRRQIASLLFNLSRLELLLGNFEGAQINSFRALEMFQEDGNPFGEAGALTNLGNLYLKQNKTKEGIKLLLKALAIAEKVKHFALIGSLTEALTEAYLTLRNFDTAINFSNRSLVMAEYTKNSSSLAKVHQTIGKIELKKDNLEKAMFNFVKSISICWEAQYLPQLFSVFIDLSKVYVQLQLPSMASRLLSMTVLHPLSRMIDKDESRQLLEQLSKTESLSTLSDTGNSVEESLEDLIHDIGLAQLEFHSDQAHIQLLQKA